MLFGAWLATFLGTIAAAIALAARARATPTGLVRRWEPVALAILLATSAGLAVSAWGGAAAVAGRAARLRDGVAVRLAVTDIAIAAARPLRIGFGADADLRLPGDAVDPVAVLAPDGAALALTADAPGTLVLAGTGDPASLADRALAARGGCPAIEVSGSRSPGTLPAKVSLRQGNVGVVVVCRGGKPAALGVRRGDRTTVSPLRWRGRFVASSLEVRAGDVLQLGAVGAALPGVLAWELPVPAGQGALLAVPADPTDCAAWGAALGGLGTVNARGDRCVVGDGTFALTARPIAPDAAGVRARGLRAAIAIAAPTVLLFLVFAAAAKSRRRARSLAALTRMAALAAGLVALAGWRLLWAHRIDVLRELAADGPRVAANVTSIALAAAALAGLAISRLVDGAARIPAAIAGWGLWGAAAIVVLDVPLPTDGTAVRLAGQLALSLVGALGLPVVERVAARRARPPAPGPLGPDGATDGETAAPATPPVPRRERLRGLVTRLGPGHALVAIAAAALLCRALAPRLVLAKLGLAYALVIAGHAALRRALAPGPHARRARVLAVGALVPATVALAAFDAGVTVVIGGIGLLLALVVAGHDAVYDADQAPRMRVLEREHARLVALHGIAAIGTATAGVAWALAADDQALLARGTTTALHAPLGVAIVFAAAAVVARGHRRAAAPWLAAALAALAVWGARDVVIRRALAGDSVAAHRVAVVVDPGYALLRDDHRFVASVAAWREASLPDAVDPWVGQGYFGARIADPGVVVSVENDYLPVLVAREQGVGGLIKTTLLLLALVVTAGATAAARLGHASRAHRARWLVAAVVGALCVYQPLAALGVLPLTGISWPGLGVDSPADLWLFVLGAVWMFFGADDAAVAGAAPTTGRAGLASARLALAFARATRAATTDERVRAAPRLRRARRLAGAALAITAAAGVVIVARAGTSALGRAATAGRHGAASGDDRVARAIAYARSLACPAPDRAGARPDDVIPTALVATTDDASTARFDRELTGRWAASRPALLGALAAGACRGRAGAFALTTDATGACRAELDAGWPAILLTVSCTEAGWRATCAFELPDDAVPLLDPPRPPRAPRIRLVSAALGVAADDLGELIGPGGIIRLRPAAPPPAAPPANPAPDGKRRGPAAAPALAAAPIPTSVDATAPGAGVRAAPTVELGGGVTLAVRADHHDVVARGDAEVLFATTSDATHAAWVRQGPAAERVLDRLALVVAGAPGQRRVWLFRPPRAFGPDTPPTIDALLADDIRRAGDRTRRLYPYGPALPELGWTNPFDVDHSLGLDGWVHAARAERADPTPAAPLGCGTLAPPAIAAERVCTTSPLDGVTECRVALQPELGLALRSLTERLIAEPAALLGKATPPTRAAVVLLRGDTGEILAQADVVPGRGPSAYAPTDPAAELALIRLREDLDPATGAPATHGEADGERADWALPIAVGSTLKPLVARAAEQAFPAQIPELLLTAIGRADTACRTTRRGRVVPPLLGHCPPTPLSGEPTTADLHDFLARSPNWYMAALGLLGLGLPDGRLAVGDAPIALSDVVLSDLAAWPTDRPLTIDDASGPVLGARGVVVDGLRRTPLWQRFEAVVGRPLCTLGDQGACQRAGERRDLCAARALPVPDATRDLRYLVALGPDRFDFYGDDRPGQQVIATREYFQLLRGSGVHPIGSLIQLVDSFGRVVYDPAEHGPLGLAASWFPSPPVGVVPSYRCRDAAGHAPAVRGADGGLCAVLQPGGTAHAALAALLADPRIAIYGGKTGTIDSLADIARRPRACAAWNVRHTVAAAPRDLAHQPGWLDCGAAPPDDSLFVLAFGVTTAAGTVPLTLGVQLQRGGKGTAARAARLYVDAIAAYLR